LQLRGNRMSFSDVQLHLSGFEMLLLGMLLPIASDLHFLLSCAAIFASI
jgi:hypothetical protein